MSTVAHRELRNHSAEILRRVSAGESFTITNNGRAVARLVPYARTPLEALRESGRASKGSRVDIGTLPYLEVPGGAGVDEIMDDLRGEW